MRGWKLGALNITVNKNINTCNHPLDSGLFGVLEDKRYQIAAGLVASVARIPCKPSTTESRTKNILMMGCIHLYKCDALLSSHFTVQYDLTHWRFGGKHRRSHLFRVG